MRQFRSAPRIDIPARRTEDDIVQVSTRTDGEWAQYLLRRQRESGRGRLVFSSAGESATHDEALPATRLQTRIASMRPDAESTNTGHLLAAPNGGYTPHAWPLWRTGRFHHRPRNQSDVRRAVWALVWPMLIPQGATQSLLLWQSRPRRAPYGRYAAGRA